MWNVLIVDDLASDRQHLLNGLHKKAACTLAQNGQEALKIYAKARQQKKPFDFILLDVTMPDMDGFAVLNSIRQAEEKSLPQGARETPVIMITTFKDSLMENYNAGWDAFITKPVDAAILIKRMEEILIKRN